MFSVAGPALNWLRSYPSDRTQLVKQEDTLSIPRLLKTGIPHCSVLALSVSHPLSHLSTASPDSLASINNNMPTIPNCTWKIHPIQVSLILNRHSYHSHPGFYTMDWTWYFQILRVSGMHCPIICCPSQLFLFLEELSNIIYSCLLTLTVVQNLVWSNQLNVSHFVIQCQLLPSHSP